MNPHTYYFTLVVIKKRTAAHTFLCFEIVVDCFELSGLYASTYRAHRPFLDSSLHAYLENVGFCGELTTWITNHFNLLIFLDIAKPNSDVLLRNSNVFLCY